MENLNEKSVVYAELPDGTRAINLEATFENALMVELFKVGKVVFVDPNDTNEELEARIDNILNK